MIFSWGGPPTGCELTWSGQPFQTPGRPRLSLHWFAKSCIQIANHSTLDSTSLLSPSLSKWGVRQPRAYLYQRLPVQHSCCGFLYWSCKVGLLCKNKNKKTCFIRRQRVVTHFVYFLFFLFLQCLRRFKALGDKDTKYGKKLNVSDHFGSWCFAEDFCWYNLQCLILTV